MFLASVSLRPEMRASSGADAVLTSAPTALTQSSTTASSFRASWTWLTSCWYWPTPIAFGSMRTSSASGSCSRRAIETAPRSDTSRSGNSFAASSDAEYTDAPASDTITFVSAQLRMPRDQIAGELVGLARRGAVADRDQLHAVPRAERGQRAQRALPVVARLVRIDRRGVEQLAGAVDDRHLDAGAEPGIEPHRHALAGGRGEQQIVQVAAEDADRFGLGLLAQPLLDVDLEVRRAA